VTFLMPITFSTRTNGRLYFSLFADILLISIVSQGEIAGVLHGVQKH